MCVGGASGPARLAVVIGSVGDESGELGPVLDAELLEAVHDVSLDGPPCDVQLFADLPVGETLRDQFGYSSKVPGRFI